jgi:hypothetical protein
MKHLNERSFTKSNPTLPPSQEEKSVMIFAVRKLVLLTIIFSAIGVLSVEAANLDSRLEKMLTAIANNNYEDFTADSIPQFKASISKDSFAELSKSFGKLLKEGYKIQYLTDLNKERFQVHLWKLTFDNDDKDVLVKLVLDKNIVGGFWLQ